MAGTLWWAAGSGPEDVLPSGLAARDWIDAGIILAGTLVAARILQALIERGATRAELESPIVSLLARSVRNLVILGGFLAALSSLRVQLGPLLGALGIGGLAIAFAGQTILENLFASVLLRTRRSIRRGDQVATLAHEGTVEEINLRVVVLRSYDGERTLLPCSQVLRNPLVNLTVNGSRRTTVPVAVAYTTDLDHAARVLREAVTEVEGVWADPAPEVWVERFGESSIDLAVRFWHEPDNATMWRVRHGVVGSVKRRLDAAGIVIPFPQRTVSFLGAEEARAAGDRPGR